MKPIHQCIQKILPENHFSYVQDGTYVRTDKDDAICPLPIINGRGIIYPLPIMNGGGIKKLMVKTHLLKRHML